MNLLVLYLIQKRIESISRPSKSQVNTKYEFEIFEYGKGSLISNFIKQVRKVQG